MGYSVQDVGKLFKAETNPNLVKFAEASYGYVDGEYQGFQSRYVKFTNELNKVLLNYANNLQDAKKTLEQISQLVKIEQTEVKGLSKTQKIYLTGLTNFIAPIVEQVGKDMKTSSLPSTGGAIEATNKPEKSSPSSDKCALQNFSPNVSLFKGHKQNPFSLDELKKFEANDPKTRANLAADVFKKTHGQDAEKILNAHSLLGTIPTGGVYFMKDNVLYFSLYDKDGNWLRVQKYCAATKSWETSSTRTGSLEVIKQDEESKKGQTPKEKPKGYSSSTIRTLQQLLNAASKILKLKPLEPTRNSKNGVDGIFGEDTRRLVADVRKKDAQAPKNIKKLIKYLQEEYVDFRLPDEEPSSQPEKAQSGLSLPSVGGYGTVRMPELGDSLKESRSKITVNNSLKKKIVKELNSIIKIYDKKALNEDPATERKNKAKQIVSLVRNQTGPSLYDWLSTLTQQEKDLFNSMKNQNSEELAKFIIDKGRGKTEDVTYTAQEKDLYNSLKQQTPEMLAKAIIDQSKQKLPKKQLCKLREIKKLQELYNSLPSVGTNKIKVDGILGKQTRFAIKYLIGYHGLDASVVPATCDKKAFARLLQQVTAAGTTKEEPASTVDYGPDVSPAGEGGVGASGAGAPVPFEESMDWLKKVRQNSFNNTFKKLTENFSR